MMIKVTFILNNLRDGVGWSENYHLAGLSSAVGAGLVRGTLQANSPLWRLLYKRRNCIPLSNAAPANNVLLSKVRVSIPGPGRNYTVYKVPPTDQRGRFGTAQTAVEAWTRLLCTVDLGSGQSGRLYFGGVPEDNVIPPDQFDPNANAWIDRFNEFLDELRLNQWQIIRRTQQSQAAAFPITLIQTMNVSLVDQRSATVTPPQIAAGPALPPRTGHVIIRGRHPSMWNGVHRYFLLADNSGLLLGPARGPLLDAAPPGAQGTIQLYADDAQDAGRVVPEGFVSRDTGSPIRPRRGRRRRAL